MTILITINNNIDKEKADYIMIKLFLQLIL